MGGAIGNAGSGAGAGAALGSAIPGVGNAVGGAAGAGIGLLSSLLGGSPQAMQTHTLAGPQAPEIGQVQAPVGQRYSNAPLNFAQGGSVPGQAPFPGQNTPFLFFQIGRALFASQQAHNIQNSFNNALGFFQGGVVPKHFPNGAPNYYQSGVLPPPANLDPVSPMLDALRAPVLQRPFELPDRQIGINSDGSSTLSGIIDDINKQPHYPDAQIAQNVPVPKKAAKVSRSVAKAAKTAPPPAADTSGADQIDEAALAEAPVNPDAPATTQQATDPNTFLGMSAGQWQGVGVASSILAKLFERNPTILQTHMAAGPQMPNINTVQVPQMQRRG
jgi:hypothetical protein